MVNTIPVPTVHGMMHGLNIIKKFFPNAREVNGPMTDPVRFVYATLGDMEEPTLRDVAAVCDRFGVGIWEGEFIRTR